MSVETAAAPDAASRARRDVPWLAAGATFLAMLDATVANLAVPDLHADFPSSSLSGLTWVITLYAVLFAALLAPAGRLADLVGRRSLYLWGVGLFTLASLACALAPNVPVLLATRAFQGAAAAAMIP
ncbi:MAG: MFS transporter, partial [Spirillospora sp.]